jgi:hypothetical protein
MVGIINATMIAVSYGVVIDQVLAVAPPPAAAVTRTIAAYAVVVGPSIVRIQETKKKMFTAITEPVV